MPIENNELSNVVIFSPAKAEISEAVLKVKELTIKGVDDVAGYEAVKAGKKVLAGYRIEITKFGKSKRDFYNAANKEILRQEDELLNMIEPTENKLKAELEAVDEEKKKQERIVLLPSRKKMLEEINILASDTEILSMDEKEFSQFFTEKKMIFLEVKEKFAREEAEKLKREAEIEQAKKEAAERARIEAEEIAERKKQEAELKQKEELERVEREKQEAIDKIKYEQDKKERLAEMEKEQKVQEEAERLAAAKVEQERTEKNKKYKAWLKKNGYNEKTKARFYINREENVFTLYKEVDSITIQ